MRIGTRLILGSLLAATILTNIGTAWAQKAPPPSKLLPSSKPPLFATLFAQPTGMNGYEEWIQAGDLVRNNEMLNQAMDADTTLTYKRRILADTTVQKALRLLREGMEKPTIAPPEAPDDNNAPFFPMASFRNLARLFYIQLYVQFAEGRVDAAIDTLSTGLRFGYRIQSSTSLSITIGSGIEVLVIRSFARHLKQLSDYQCSRVRHLVEECIEWPSAVAAVLNSEKQAALNTLEAKRNDPVGLKEMFKRLGGFGDEAEPAEQERMQKMLGYLDSQPADLGMVIDHAKEMIRDHYATALLNLKLPIQERKPRRLLGDKSLSGSLCLLVPSSYSVTDKYDFLDALLHLLGTHAALHSYRWEFNNLPANLAQLRLGKLEVDPFSGASLSYQRKDKTYVLSSRNHIVHDTDGLPTTKPAAPLELQVSR